MRKKPMMREAEQKQHRLRGTGAMVEPPTHPSHTNAYLGCVYNLLLQRNSVIRHHRRDDSVEDDLAVREELAPGKGRLS